MMPDREMTREELSSEYVKRGQEIKRLEKEVESSYSKDDLKTIFEARVKYCRGRLRLADTYRDKIIWASNLDCEQAICDTLIGELIPHTDDTFESWYEENIRPLITQCHAADELNEIAQRFISETWDTKWKRYGGETEVLPSKTVVTEPVGDEVIKVIRELEPGKQYALIFGDNVNDDDIDRVCDLLAEAREKCNFVVARMSDLEVRENAEVEKDASE